MLEQIAALSDVRIISVSYPAQLVGKTSLRDNNKNTAKKELVKNDNYTGLKTPSFAERANRLKKQIKMALDKKLFGNKLFIGSVTSQGDVTHKAALARTTFGVDGTGIKIGVLSDGVGGLATSQATGDLGTVTILPGQAGSGGCERCRGS